MTHAEEVAQGDRFKFGANWRQFLALLNDERIAEAEQSLRRMLEVDDLNGKTFLDIGSGSGLFSLAARRLGAKVHSLDFDPDSVGCTEELRRRYFPGDVRSGSDWIVEKGSALDTEYIRGLGRFDVVYSWGVLHHTGNMWLGLGNAELAVGPGGRLFVAIYNDVGSKTARWLWVKQTYNALPEFLRPLFAAVVSVPQECKILARALFNLRPGDYLRTWTDYSRGQRGMSKWRDIVDWVGGLPYEVATPDQIFDFYRARGFKLTKLRCGNVGIGCNEFVFIRES